MTPSDMTGKAAIVTGAAAGLGRATALQLARAGASTLLVDISADALAEIAREAGAKAVAYPADLSDAAQCAGIVPAAIKNFGRLDALCNVAGVFMPAHAHEMPIADFNKTLAVNLAAPFLLIQAALPHLIENKGAVVNVTSCAAHRAQAYSAAYCASKAGLMHMTKALAMEYIDKGVRFNSVAPGGMMTALAGNLRTLQNPDVSLLKRVAPLRGLVEIEDVAAMVAFLASDAARGYHGAAINLDNGITAD